MLGVLLANDRRQTVDPMTIKAKLTGFAHRSCQFLVRPEPQAWKPSDMVRYGPEYRVPGLMQYSPVGIALRHTAPLGPPHPLVQGIFGRLGAGVGTADGPVGGGARCQATQGQPRQWAGRWAGPAPDSGPVKGR